MVALNLNAMSQIRDTTYNVAGLATDETPLGQNCLPNSTLITAARARYKPEKEFSRGIGYGPADMTIAGTNVAAWQHRFLVRSIDQVSIQRSSTCFVQRALSIQLI